MNLQQSFEQFGSLYFSMNYLIQNHKNEVPFYNLRLQDIPLGPFKVNAGFGYTSFQISSLLPFGSFNPSRYTSLKGGNIFLQSQKASLILFAGQLYGLSGFSIKKSTVYGLKGIFNLTKDWTLGAGYIRGNNLASNSDPQNTVDCDFFTLDSSIRVFKEIYFLGDFKYALSSGERKSNDYQIKIGPYIRGNVLSLQFYYNYITPDYPQIERVGMKDREGFTFIGELRPFSALTLFGSMDTYNENLEMILERPVTDYLTFTYGANLSFPTIPSISLRLSSSERDSEKGDTTITDSSYDTFFLTLFKYYRRYSLNFRYIRGNFNDFLDPTQNFLYSNYSFEIRRIFLNASIIYLNGYFTEQKSRTGLYERENYTFQTGATLRLTPNFLINAQANYTSGKDKISGQETKGIGGEAGINYNFLPWKINFSLRYRYSRIKTIFFETIQRDNHQILLSITKSLTWGRRAAPYAVKKFSDLFRGTGTVEGYVFVDQNQNSLKDPEEETLSDIDIVLDGRIAATSDDDGYYRISSIIPGEHTVYLHLRKVPAYYEPITGQERELNVKGKKSYHINFRLGSIGYISGKVVLDVNENGTADTEEPPVEEIKVNLYKNGNIISSYFSDSFGFFKFDNLFSGEYKVEVDLEEIQERYRKVEESSVRIKLKPGEEIRDITLLVNPYKKPTVKKVFAAYEGNISGRVINDSNRNGKIDPDEKGIADILLWLKPVNENLQLKTLKTYTDEEGKFAFESVTSGEYILYVDEESLPEGSEFTSPSSRKIKVLPGQKIENQDFLIYY